MALFPKHENPPADEYAIQDESEEPGQFYEGAPIPVTITGEATKAESAERVSYNTYNITGANTAPTPLLPRNPNRARAIINIVAQANSPVFFLHSDPSLVLQMGFRLLGTNSSIEIKNQRALWGFVQSPAGGTVTLAVMDESYDVDAVNPNPDAQ